MTDLMQFDQFIWSSLSKQNPHVCAQLDCMKDWDAPDAGHAEIRVPQFEILLLCKLAVSCISISLPETKAYSAHDCVKQEPQVP